MDRIEPLLNDLMPTLLVIAGQPNAHVLAERQIDDCLGKLGQTYRQSFLKQLGDRAADEMAVAPSAPSRTFWKTVAEYAAAAKHSSA